MNEMDALKNEMDILKKALSKQAQRVANLTLDLDIAHAQIDQMLAEKSEDNQPSEDQ